MEQAETETTDHEPSPLERLEERLTCQLFLSGWVPPSVLAQVPRHDTASSSSAPLDNPFCHGPYLAMYSPFGRHPSGGHRRIVNQGYRATGEGNNAWGNSLLYIALAWLALAGPLVFTRSSGGRGRNGGGDIFADYEMEAWRYFYYDFAGGQAHRDGHLLGIDYDLEAQRRIDYDLQEGGQAHWVARILGAGGRRTGGAAAAPVQEPSEAATPLVGFMVQALAGFLPACVTVFSIVKDAPDHIKFTIFGGLAFITVGLFVGILSRSVARRGLAFRLVSFSAIAVLVFSVASQLSSRTYIALTALVGVVVNLIIMLLRF